MTESGGGAAPPVGDGEHPIGPGGAEPANAAAPERGDAVGDAEHPIRARGAQPADAAVAEAGAPVGDCGQPIRAVGARPADAAAPDGGDAAGEGKHPIREGGAEPAHAAAAEAGDAPEVAPPGTSSEPPGAAASEYVGAHPGRASDGSLGTAAAADAVAAPAPPPSSAGRRHPRWWPAVAAVIAFLVSVPLIVILLEDGKPERIELPLPAADGFAGPGGSELATLLVKTRDRTFHATYVLTAGDTRQTLEWWSAAGRVRQDTITPTEGGDVRTASFKLSDKEAVVCRQEPGQPWSCEGVPVPIGGDPRGLMASLQAQLSGRPVAVRSDVVNGRDARCFSVGATPGSEAVELCSDLDGIPLRLTSPEAKLELTSLDESVPENIFKPPA